MFDFCLIVETGHCCATGKTHTHTHTFGRADECTLITRARAHTCKPTHKHSNTRNCAQTHAVERRHTHSGAITRKCTQTHANSRTLAQNTCTRTRAKYGKEYAHTHAPTHTCVYEHTITRPVIRSVKLLNLWKKERKLTTKNIQKYKFVYMCVLHLRFTF